MNDPDFEIRAKLGERLAPHIEQDAVRDQVLGLLLDESDTLVTYRTALALLARCDRAGVELVVAAEARADADTSQWIFDAFVTFRRTSLGAHDAFLQSALEALVSGGDTGQRGAAAGLLRDLGWSESGEFAR